MPTAPPIAHKAGPDDPLDSRIESAVAHVSYPAHPPVLIESAEHNGAAADVIAALRLLPDEAYGSFPEVAASITAARRLGRGLRSPSGQ
ncbi:DUF2795 domain-containing protein [Paraburkholderia ferrariae]|uniref:DUF2795 domain-containing protein n=1 Tax=Paraburkholderia ferrariae TaxID=386056 RepID=UPI0005A67CFB|nr:DUF2795 domain-containing protein [Paraburkholderia ferrariae]